MQQSMTRSGQFYCFFPSTSAPLLTSWKCLRTARIIYLTRLRLTRFDTRIHMVPRPNHPPGFIAPCLPTGAATPPAGAGWLHEIKHDGFRLLVLRAGERVRSLPAAATTSPTAIR